MNNSSIGMASRPAIDRHFRLQWESAQNTHVLLYPEGMVKLNRSAGEILMRCDGNATVGKIIEDLEAAYAATGLSDEVITFLKYALDQEWLKVMT